MEIIWIIEDEKGQAGELAVGLMRHYAVKVFTCAADINRVQPVLSHRSMPGLIIICSDALNELVGAVYKQVMERIQKVPVILVVPEGTPVSAVDTQTCMFLMPGRLDLLLQQIGQFMRERENPFVSELHYRDLLLDTSRYTLRIAPNQESENLPFKEALILRLLIEKSGGCLSRNEISQHIWNGLKVSERTIDSHVSRLRKRLLHSEVHIKSVYGGGYHLE